MKVRKLAVALALVGGLGSSVAHALGLGEVELQSYLNEPLDADISLRNTGQVSADDVYVKLASPEVFRRVGVDRNFFLTNLDFKVKTSPNGQLIVNVTSRQAVREPYLDFLIEVTWPSGKLLREYSLLLDPPVYAEQGNTRQTVQPAASASSSDRNSSSGSSASGNDRAREARSGNDQVAGNGGNRQKTFGPTDGSDTLWNIALKVRPGADYSPQKVMLALQDLNPQAFMDGNINRLKRGQVLRIPTAEQINSRSNSQAVREVTAQNNALKKSRSPVDATDNQQTAGGASQESGDSGDELRLLAGDDKAVSADEGASAGGENGVAGGVKNAGNTVAAAEELDKAERENDELNSRVGDLESQVETLKRLIELKNSQLAELQNKSATEADAANDSGTAAGNDAEIAMAGGSGESAGAQPDAMSPDAGNTSAESDEAASQAGSENQDAMAQTSDSDAATGAGNEAANSESETGDNAAGAEAGSMGSDQMSSGDQNGMTADNAAMNGDTGRATENMAAADAAGEQTPGEPMSGDEITSDEMAGDESGGQGSGAQSDTDTSNAMSDSEGMAAADGRDNGSAEGGAENGADTSQAVTSSDTADQSVSADDSQMNQDAAEPVTEQSTSPQQDRGLMDKIIHGLKTNPVYQLVAGGIAVLLLILLGLLARRNAKREKDFYDELNRESHDDSDNVDLDFTGDEEDAPQADGSDERDVVAEADAYLVYGRYDQAAEVLESGISQEPSRTDLRTKLLGVYAEAGNRDAFEKQYRELETLDDDAALVEANALRERLDESESAPSIDDLESQLRSGSDTDTSEQSASDESFLSSGFMDYRDDHENSGRVESDDSAQDREGDHTEDDLDDALADLESESSAQTPEQSPTHDESDLTGEPGDDKDSPIEYDLSGVVLDAEEQTPAEDDKAQDVSDELDSMDDVSTDDDPALDFELDEQSDELTGDDFGSLELDEDFAGKAGQTAVQDNDRATADDEQPAFNEDPELATDEARLATDDDGKLDESFLDDLDAELDKVAGEESDESEALDDDNLEELELDVSDEDLALMEEMAEKPDADKPEVADDGDDAIQLPDDAPDSLDDSLDLQEEAGDTDAEPDADADDPDQALETLRPETSGSGFTAEDIDEKALDDEDDFDFLTGTDEAATKLDLARAYVEMGDADGARDILEEVSIEGSDDQKSEAKLMLKNLS